jgi:hypothetical protein
VYPLVLGLALAAAACGDDQPATETDDGTGTVATMAGSVGSDGVMSTGVDTTAGDTEAPPAGLCEGPTAVRYDPMGGLLDAYPDDFYTVADDTPTGRRVDLRLGENVLLTGNAATFSRVFEAMSTLDGFGTTAGIYVQFDGPVDTSTLPSSGDGSGTTDASVLVVRLDVDPPQLIDFEWEAVAEDPGQGRTTLVMRPMVPLQPQARYGYAVRQTLLDAEGNCIAPSPVMAGLLEGEAADPALDEAAAGVDEVASALVGLGVITQAQDLSAAVAFTTQHTVDDSAEIAAQIRAATPPAYNEVSACVDPGAALPYEQCDGIFTADDFTVDGVVDPSLSPQSQYDLPVVIYLPKNATPPYSTLVYGHGLGGDRFQAAQLADFAAPLGLAVVAIDAPKHGDHPDGPGFNAVLDFFGLSLNFADPLDALVLRDNFRKGAYDRIALVQMLLAGVDLQGSPAPELDPTSLHYLGVSLGGLMGPQLAAFVPEFDTTTFIVPGARVTNIVAEGDQFSVVVDLFAGMATDGEIARFFPLLQGVIDRGDPGTFAPHVADDRIMGFDHARPQVLVQMVLDDNTVPNSANTYFARAVGVPHLGEVIFPIGTVPLQPRLPTVGNLDADHTGGSFQFDVVVADDGVTTEPATHSNVARSTLAQLQITTFLDTYLADGVSQIVDPYVELGVR